MNKEQKIEELKKFINSSDFATPGNSRGKAVYQEIPFSEFKKGVKIRRSNNRERLDLLINNYDFRGKTVLDVGCNIGYFGFELSKLGANYIGIDADNDSIKVANSLKDIYEVNNVEFYNLNYKEDSIRNILSKHENIDYIFFFSVNHWLFQDIGINEFIRLTSLFLKDGQRIIYEASSAIGAYYPKLLREKNIFKLINKIGYNKIDFLGTASADNLSGGNKTRNIYIAEFNQELLIDRFINSKKKKVIKIQDDKEIYSFKNYFIKKAKKSRGFLLKNEFDKLNKLKFYKYFPIPLSLTEKDNHIYLILKYIKGKSLIKYSIVPQKYRDHFRESLNEIIDILDKEKIIHRDLGPQNILINKKFNKIYLVDFEFAIFEDEKLNPHNIKEEEVLEKSLLKLGGKRNNKKYLYSLYLNQYSTKPIKSFYTNSRSLKRWLRAFLSFLKKKINDPNLIKKIVKRYIFFKK